MLFPAVLNSYMRKMTREVCNDSSRSNFEGYVYSKPLIGWRHVKYHCFVSKMHLKMT